MSTVHAEPRTVQPKSRVNPRDSWPAWTDEITFRIPRPTTLTATYGDLQMDLTSLPPVHPGALKRPGVRDVRWVVRTAGEPARDVTFEPRDGTFACSCGVGDSLDPVGFGVPCVHLVALDRLGLLVFPEPSKGGVR